MARCNDDTTPALSHIPTPDQTLVMGLALAGCSPAEIADILKTTPGELKSEFAAELDYVKTRGVDTDFARRMMSGYVVAALFQSAMSGSVPAQTFWLKSQLGWQESTRQEVEFTGDQSPTIEVIYEGIAQNKIPTAPGNGVYNKGD